MLAFQLIVALKRTHKPRSKLVAEHCHALEQLLPHFASGSCRIVTESDEFVYLLAKLSTRIKLHNVPVSFTAAISLLEQPGASFSIKIYPSEVLCGFITVLYQHTQQTSMFLLSLKTLPADLQSSVKVLAVLAWLRFAAVL